MITVKERGKTMKAMKMMLKIPGSLLPGSEQIIYKVKNLSFLYRS
jgi:hypothetical protein